MFIIDDSHAAMSHTNAAGLIHALATHALGATVTGTLSLRGRRIFLAEALRARRQRARGTRAAREGAAVRAASPPGPPTRTAAVVHDDKSASSNSDDDSDGEADGVVVAGPPIDASVSSASALGPGDATAVRFDTRRGGVKVYGGTVVKIMARTMRVAFLGCAGVIETYDVKSERVLPVAA